MNIYIQTCESYISCIFVRTIPIVYKVPGFPRILLPRQPSGLEPGIVAPAPQSSYPLSHVAGNRIRENPDNFGISTYYKPSSGGTRPGMVIRRNSGAAYIYMNNKSYILLVRLNRV